MRGSTDGTAQQWKYLRSKQMPWMNRNHSFCCFATESQLCRNHLGKAPQTSLLYSPKSAQRPMLRLAYNLGSCFFFLSLSTQGPAPYSQRTNILLEPLRILSWHGGRKVKPLLLAASEWHNLTLISKTIRASRTGNERFPGWLERWFGTEPTLYVCTDSTGKY